MNDHTDPTTSPTVACSPSDSISIEAATGPSRHRGRALRAVSAAAALTLLVSACGSDDDADPAEPAPTTEAPTDDAMDDDAMDDDAMDDDAMDDGAMDDDAMDDGAMDDDAMDDGLDAIRAELAAAGLGEAQVDCVVDASISEWGADALTAPGQASDEQLLRLGEITFGCL